MLLPASRKLQVVPGQQETFVLGELAGYRPSLYQKNREHLMKQQENAPLENSCALACVVLVLLQRRTAPSSELRPPLLWFFCRCFWHGHVKLALACVQRAEQGLNRYSLSFALSLLFICTFTLQCSPEDAFLAALPVCCQIFRV